MWSADECFGGRSLNRGIELCAVVEQMYSTYTDFIIYIYIYFVPDISYCPTTFPFI